MLLRNALLALLLFAATPALAQHDDAYEGVVGATPVILGLSWKDADGLAAGQYAYRRTRIDIDLNGHWRGENLDLTSQLTGDRLALSRSGTDLVGQLTTAKGRKLPVTLHRAAAAPDAPADLPATFSLYERLQLTGLTLVPQKTETINGKTIRWRREGLTGISMFRLEGGYAPAAMAQVNQALARDQWTEVLHWLQCPGEGGQGSGTDSSQADRPWLGPTHLSYVWHSSWSCAGTAHPDYGAEGHSFDARTGHELTLDEVLPVAGHPAPPEMSDAWFAYRSDLFAPAVVALMKRYHRAEMAPPKDPDDEDACDYSRPDVWDFPSWALTPKGLWLGASFPHVAGPCRDPAWAVIPWSALPSRNP